MSVDWVTSHWNDVLTILSFLIASAVGLYQIKNIRAQQAKIRILEVTGKSYFPQKQGGELGGFVGTPPSDDDIERTCYTIEIYVENDGREPATISGGNLSIYNTGENIALSAPHGDKKLQANDRDTLSLSGSGGLLDEYPESLSGTLTLDTTAGQPSEEVTFPLSS